MSTVQDEADAGPIDLKSEVESDSSSNGANSGQDGELFDPDPSSRIVEILQEARQDKSEEEDLRSNDGVFQGYGRFNQDEAPRDDIRATSPNPTQGQPSSADGSLSTPDDTPSVQVSSHISFT